MNTHDITPEFRNKVSEHYSKNNWDELLEICNQELIQGRDAYPVVLYKNISLLKLGEIHLALKGLEDLLAANASDPLLLMSIGEAYLRLNSQASAHQFLKRAYQIEGQDPAIALAYIESLERMGNQEEAELIGSRVTQLHPDRHEIIFKYIDILNKKHQWKEIYACLDLLWFRFPDQNNTIQKIQGQINAKNITKSYTGLACRKCSMRESQGESHTEFYMKVGETNYEARRLRVFCRNCKCTSWGGVPIAAYSDPAADRIIAEYRVRRLDQLLQSQRWYHRGLCGSVLSLFGGGREFDRKTEEQIAEFKRVNQEIVSQERRFPSKIPCGNCLATETEILIIEKSNREEDLTNIKCWSCGFRMSALHQIKYYSPSPSFESLAPTEANPDIVKYARIDFSGAVISQSEYRNWLDGSKECSTGEEISIRCHHIA
jgi:tetratricopeptide (TPR) repeat protein